jgi:hypothetical protein
MREDIMKSRLLLLTGVVALIFAGPINAPAATITIDDNGLTNETLTPILFGQSGFVAPPVVLQQIGEIVSPNRDGVLTISGIYNAANPLGPGMSQTFNFNIAEGPGTCGGSLTCSDTLSITLTGRAGDTGNMMALVDFRSGGGDNVPALPGGSSPAGTFVPPEGEFFAVSAFGLDVNVFSDVPVPGPIVGAGLPGLILACGALLALARRRRQLVA